MEVLTFGVWFGRLAFYMKVFFFFFFLMIYEKWSFYFIKI